jgi:hypothetical protein
MVRGQCAQPDISWHVTDNENIHCPFESVLWDARNPPFQAPFDPEKKTIVILGSGWASTSLLKSINTDLYNVVCIHPCNISTCNSKPPCLHLTRFGSDRSLCLLETISCSRLCCPVVQLGQSMSALLLSQPVSSLGTNPEKSKSMKQNVPRSIHLPRL